MNEQFALWPLKKSENKFNKNKLLDNDKQVTQQDLVHDFSQIEFMRQLGFYHFYIPTT